MIAEFTHILTIDDEDVEVEISYEATSYGDEVEIGDIFITLDGDEISLSPENYKRILDACHDRVFEDFIADDDAYGDLCYDLSRDD
jgi:hypothetical protein